MSSNLKLIAQDEEQLTIISSLTQDSIVKTNEMGYDNKTKRFALLMNRYRHEEEDPSRIRCAIHFDYADTVKSIGCLLYTSPSPRDPKTSRMPSSA